MTTESQADTLKGAAGTEFSFALDSACFPGSRAARAGARSKGDKENMILAQRPSSSQLNRIAGCLGHFKPDLSSRASCFTTQTGDRVYRLIQFFDLISRRVRSTWNINRRDLGSKPMFQPKPGLFHVEHRPAWTQIGTQIRMSTKMELPASARITNHRPAESGVFHRKCAFLSAQCGFRSLWSEAVA